MAASQQEQFEADDEVPECPNGLFNFSDQVNVVTDPDEEILELYMNLANTSPETSRAEGGGLGFLDSNKTVIDIELDLVPPAEGATNALHLEGVTAAKTNKVRKGSQESVTVSARIQQDLGALKSRRGDTGSVLWRSSLHLARQLLTEHRFPPSKPLLNQSVLSRSRVLELGAGTGLLAILLAPLCASFTASDRLENLKLVQKNLEINGMASPSSIDDVKSKPPTLPKLSKKSFKPPISKARVKLEEIDWLAVSSDRQRHSASPRPSSTEEYDLILAVDCIFNENLVQPLVDTLAHYCTKGGKTVVWIVVELRSAEVLTLFLDKWMHDPSGPWVVVRLGEDDMGRWGNKRGRWVGWVGWRP